jgi:hypothetical protein
MTATTIKTPTPSTTDEQSPADVVVDNKPPRIPGEPFTWSVTSDADGNVRVVSGAFVWEGSYDEYTKLRGM